MLQQICSVRLRCKKRRRRESHLQCCSRDNEAARKQFVRLSNRGQEPLHCHKGFMQRKGARSYKQQNVQEIEYYR